jgi:hypothetical protein
MKTAEAKTDRRDHPDLPKAALGAIFWRHIHQRYALFSHFKFGKAVFETNRNSIPRPQNI